MAPRAFAELGLTDATSKFSGLAAGWANVLAATKMQKAVPMHFAFIELVLPFAVMTFAGAILLRKI